MRQFWSFIKKEFHHVFRDRWTMVILLIMPVVQMILFGFAISTEVRNVNVAVLAPEHDELTRKIAARLDASEYFTVVGMVENESQIEDAFKKGKIDFAIIFKESFEDGLLSADGTSLALVTDATNSNTATTVAMYAQAIIADCIMDGRTMTAGITPNIKMLYNPQMRSSYNFVPGLMGLIIILICAMMTSISIVREKEKGTMELLLVSPVKPITIVLSKMVPYMALSLINYLTILLMATTLMDVPVAGSFWTLTLLALVYIVVALSLGLLVSSKVDSQIAALLISGMVLMVPIMFFSGLMFPTESMPKFFQWLSCVIPATWFIDAARKIMIQGLEFKYILKDFAVLCGMAVFLMMISMKSIKNRLS